MALESGRVCTKSPENTAADLGTVVPLIHAMPFEYSMADAESAASNCAGTNIANMMLNADRIALCIILKLTSTSLAIFDNPIPL